MRKMKWLNKKKSNEAISFVDNFDGVQCERVVTWNLPCFVFPMCRLTYGYDEYDYESHAFELLSFFDVK